MRFLLPIQGLTIFEPWQIGVVRLHPGSDAQSVVGSEADHLFSNEIVGDLSVDVAAELARGTVAEVESSDIDTALDLVTVSTDLLRVFQRIRFGMATTTMFGLPGQVFSSNVRYLVAGDKPGPGNRNRGDVLGWTFSSDALAKWRDSPALTSVAALVGTNEPLEEGPRRARLGVQLLSQAILEHRPAFKILNLLIALESMLLERSSVSQSFRLARRAAYFTCGRPDDSLCGRDRPSCQCLKLDPGANADRTAIKRLRQLADIDVRWRCSEWLTYQTWYGLRSSVAHGDDAQITRQEASRAEFWILRWLTEPVLLWLMEHPAAPLAALDADLSELQPVPAWQALIPDPDTYRRENDWPGR
jgi:hypothetical protein